MGSNYFNILRSGLSGGTPPPFTPASLFTAGEQGFWFDPSDFSTMFQDTAGTIPVTAVGQTVGKILDKSGNNNHLVSQTTLPTLEQDANLNYYINLVTSKLLIASLNLTATDEVSIFKGVYRSRTSFTEMLFEHSVNSSTNPGAFRSFFVQNLNNFTFANSVTADGATSTTPSVPSLIAIYCSSKRSTPIIQSQINNNAIVTNTVAQGTGNYGTYGFYVGNRADNTIPFQGRIYQAILRNKLSTAQEISDARAYINSKTAAY